MCPATSGRFRPLIRFGKSRKSSKNRKNRDFSKIDILLFSGRKYDIWPEITSLDPGKPPESLYWPSYIIWLYFVKSQKIAFFTSKISIKIFSGRIFWPMWPGHQINIRGQHIIFPPPKPYNLKVCTPPLPTCMHHQRFQNFPKNPLFSRKCCFCCFCCFLGVANVVFQNLQNQEMLLPIFIFFIRRLEKKLFHFEVMFLKGGVVLWFTSLHSVIIFQK